jgi:ketosteroid isomerase-like protein
MKDLRITSLLLCACMIVCVSTGQAAEISDPVACETAWDNAFAHRDFRALAAIFADSFVQLGDDGTMMNKQQALRAVRTITLVPQMNFTTSRVVRITGDTATIAGIYVETGRVSKSDPRIYRLKLRYADVYARTGGTWKAVLGFGHPILFQILK